MAYFCSQPHVQWAATRFLSAVAVVVGWTTESPSQDGDQALVNMSSCWLVVMNKNVGRIVIVVGVRISSRVLDGAGKGGNGRWVGVARCVC